MTGDEMRAVLTAALAEVPELDAEFVADRILPTVRGIVGGELRAMADNAWRAGYDACRRGEQKRSPYRANALDPS